MRFTLFRSFISSVIHMSVDIKVQMIVCCFRMRMFKVGAFFSFQFKQAARVFGERAVSAFDASSDERKWRKAYSPPMTTHFH